VRARERERERERESKRGDTTESWTLLGGKGYYYDILDGQPKEK